MYAWHRQRMHSGDVAVTPPHRIQHEVATEVPAEYDAALLQVPSSGIVDPFGVLPIEVEYTTNELLHYYLGSNTAYWSTAYSLSTKVKPSLKAAWESFMPCAEHFHILMARSALHQLRISPDLNPSFRKNLQVASIAHQGKALTSLRKKVSRGINTDQRDVFTAVISMATFEQRYGQRDKAKIHFAVGRNILHGLGKQDHAEEWQKELQILWFEGIYSEPEASFMWSSSDLDLRHQHFVELLKDTDQIWRTWQQEPLLVRSAGGRKRFVSSRSRLHGFLHRDCKGRLLSIYQDIDEHIAQFRCLLTYVAVVVGLWETETKLRTSKDAVTAIRAYTDWVETMIVQSELDASSAVPDLLWIMLQDPCQYQPPATSLTGSDISSVARLRDFDFQECHRRVSGIANAMKHLSGLWQQHIRSWLLGFISGETYRGKLVVEQFAFSYAAAHMA